MATRKHKITYLADIILLLDGAILEEVGQGFCQTARDQSFPTYYLFGYGNLLSFSGPWFSYLLNGHENPRAYCVGL